MARALPQVFTIAPGQDFIRTTIAALLDGTIIDLPFAREPERLADLTIYVPTRRLRPIMEAAFAEALAPRPALLPRIRPLGEPGDPLEKIAAGEAESAILPGAAKPIPALQRRFELLPLIGAWRKGLREAIAEAGAEEAAPVPIRENLALAEALGRLIDEMRIAGIPLADLRSAAPPGYDPAKFDAYWAQSREFLRIAAEYWPDRLAALGAADAADVANSAVEAEANRLRESDSKAPILILGSTGSVIATARLMKAVSRLDHGAVVLPGLDLDLDERGWADIASEKASLPTRFAHPQAALKRTLTELGITRDHVRPLGIVSSPAKARERALSEALRPAETVDLWREARLRLDETAAFSGLSVLQAADEREEALSVAILMRETLEDPAANVAFVTADRALARRVATELSRWGIEAADSAGESLAERPVGTFLKLFIRAATRRDGASILAMLRHPFARLGFDGASLSALTDALEILVFRGRHFAPDCALSERVRHLGAREERHAHPAAKTILPEIRARLPELAGVLDREFAPFDPAGTPLPLADFAAGLLPALERLTSDEAGLSTLAGEADSGDLVTLLREISAYAGECILTPPAAASAVDLLLSETTLPPARRGHARAAILGPLEARLISASRIIVGGLNEGVFPPIAEEDPFLNRTMRLDLGLQPPERRIGQSAHDFVMFAAQQQVILTRAARSGEQPALPSRFLRRLEAFAGKTMWAELMARGARILGYARALDAPESYAPIPEPEPVPAAPRLPERLSITEVETLRRDPYAIYARHILKLQPLEPLDPTLDARERGTILHACLEAYAASEPPREPEEAARHLREIGTELFEPIRHESEAYHFWWQQFLAIIPGFVAFDRARREAGLRIFTEVKGEMRLALPDELGLTLSGKADRIEIDPEGKAAILDYKSGTPPGASAVRKGLAPQLPITAEMARAGAFRALPPVTGIREIAYVPIGGKVAPEPKPILDKTMPLEDLIAGDIARLKHELVAFGGGERAYRARIMPKSGSAEGDYDHLARIAEWRATGGASGEDDAPDEGEAS